MEGGLSLYDAGFAVKVGGVAVLVVLVRNSDKIPLLNVGSTPSSSSGRSGSARPAPAGSGTLHV
jgi:hypothetical protein